MRFVHTVAVVARIKLHKSLTFLCVCVFEYSKDQQQQISGFHVHCIVNTRHLFFIFLGISISVLSILLYMHHHYHQCLRQPHRDSSLRCTILEILGKRAVSSRLLCCLVHYISLSISLSHFLSFSVSRKNMLQLHKFINNVTQHATKRVKANKTLTPDAPGAKPLAVQNTQNPTHSTTKPSAAC